MNMEDAKDYIKAFWKAYGRDPSDVYIKDHQECGTQSDRVSWFMPFRIFKADDISLKRATFVEPDEINKYIEVCHTPKFAR